jgi:hypothetical protein
MIELKTILQQINEEDQPDKTPSICYYPGGFKPPHEGHYEVVKDLISRPDVTKVIVLIGHSERDGITKEMSKKIWDLYQEIQPISQVTIRIAENPSPVKDIFSIMDDDLELRARVAGVAGDADVQSYFNSLTKAFGDRIITVPVEEKVVTQGKRASGTQVREYLNQLKKTVLKLRSISDKNSTEYSKARNEYLNTYKIVQGCFPDFVTQKGKFDDILNILGIPVLDIETLKENEENGNLVIVVPYDKTPDLENWLNTNLIPFEYSQKAFNGEKRRMLIPNLGDPSNEQRQQVLAYLDKVGIEHNIEENLFSIKWWKKQLKEVGDNGDVIQDFIDFAVDALELKQIPKINFTDDEDLARNMHSLGAYNPKTDELLVVKGSRLTADILRTLAHELVHRKQDELGMLDPDSGKTGSPIENEANAAAGVLLRQFGQYRPEIFETLNEAEEKKPYKIYCDMDGVLVDFDRGYFELTGEKASFGTDPEKFWAPITKAGAAFWIKLQWMPDGRELWNFIKSYSPVLLSAPSRQESSKIGKFTWVKRNIPGTKLILRAADRKQEFATPNSILIDDRADNIQRWNDAGGIGIHHTSAESTIKQLEDIFKKKDNTEKLNENKLINSLKSKFTNFISKLKQEKKETIEAFKLIVKASKGEITLTDEQKTQIGEQLKDLLKTVGLTAVAIMPGGVIVAGLLKLLKQQNLIIPSSFK